MPSGLLNPMQPTSPLTPLEPPTPPSSTLLPPLLIWRENVALALSVRNVTQFLPEKKHTWSGCTLGGCTLSAHIARIFWEQVNLDGLSWRKKWINGRERRIRDFLDIVQVENLPDKSFIHFEVF